MKTKTSRIGALLLASMLTLTSFSFAAEATKDSITQGQAAKLVAYYLGFFPQLPANPTEHDCIDLLLQNNISPFNGWEMTKILTVADFAKIIVGAMGDEDQLSGDLNDPKTYIQYLKGLNVPVESVSETLDQLESKPEGKAPKSMSSKQLLSDALSEAFAIGSEPGEGEAGNVGFADAPIPVAAILAVVESLPTVTRNPTTPN